MMSAGNDKSNASVWMELISGEFRVWARLIRLWVLHSCLLWHSFKSLDRCKIILLEHKAYYTQVLVLNCVIHKLGFYLISLSRAK